MNLSFVSLSSVALAAADLHKQIKSPTGVKFDFNIMCVCVFNVKSFWEKCTTLYDLHLLKKQLASWCHFVKQCFTEKLLILSDDFM